MTEGYRPGGGGRGASSRRGSALVDAVVAVFIVALLLVPLLEGMVVARRLALRAEGGLETLRRADSCLEALRAARGSLDPRGVAECQGLAVEVERDSASWLRKIRVSLGRSGGIGNEVYLVTLAE